MHLEPADQRAILEQRIKQFTAERFQHEINREVCTALADQAGIDAADQAIATLDVAIEIHQTRLAALG